MLSAHLWQLGAVLCVGAICTGVALWLLDRASDAERAP